jgi:hypothetical protein
MILAMAGRNDPLRNEPERNDPKPTILVRPV